MSIIQTSQHKYRSNSTASILLHQRARKDTLAQVLGSQVVPGFLDDVMILRDHSVWSRSVFYLIELAVMINLHK